MINFVRRITMLLPLAVFASQPALAGDADSDWRASDESLGTASWTGFTISPEIAKNTLKLSGTGGEILNNPKGFRAGLELGYNRQFENLVVGVAGDAFYSWIDGVSLAKSGGPYEAKQPYMGSLKGRIGYIYERFMVYGTGGLALSKLEIEDRVTGKKAGNTMTGWVAGAGVEYAWTKKITTRLEYLRTDFGTDTYNSLPATTNRVSAAMDFINLNVIFRF